VLTTRRREDFIDLQERFARGAGIGFRALRRSVNRGHCNYGEQSCRARRTTPRQRREATMAIRIYGGHGLATLPVTRSAARIGRRLTRLPVAAKIALVRAGATGGTLGSPTPVGLNSLGIMCTWISGDSNMRSIW